MGFRSFRERVLAKADALDARADRMEAELATEKAEREQARVDAQAEAERDWFHAEAARLRVDHDEMVKRAERFGLGLPSPRRPRGLERAATGYLSVTSRIPGAALFGALGSEDAIGDVGNQRPEPYVAWVNLIRAEERVADVEGSPSAVDRALLRTARWAFKHSQ